MDEARAQRLFERVEVDRTDLEAVGSIPRLQSSKFHARGRDRGARMPQGEKLLPCRDRRSRTRRRLEAFRLGGTYLGRCQCPPLQGWPQPFHWMSGSGFLQIKRPY
jgi:hypothetical protein